MKLEVNGLSIEADFSEEVIQHDFIPALQRWTQMARNSQQRVFVFLMGPAGSGKSTAGLFLEELSKTIDGVAPIQTVGMDGFHYTNDRLKKMGLISRKGASFTFDTDKLKDKIVEGKNADNLWPVYSRTLHDPIEDALRITSPIILIEGNYLFLDDEKWREIASLADEKIWLEVDEGVLEKRLVERKMAGGSDEATARHHYQTSDRLNIVQTITQHLAPDTIWKW